MNIRLIVLSIMICLGCGLWAGDCGSAFSVCDVLTDVVADTSKCDMCTRCFYITQDVLRKGKWHTHAWLFVYDNTNFKWVCSDAEYVVVGKPLSPIEECAADIACGSYIFSLRRMKDGRACVALGDTQLLVLEAQRRCAWNSKGKCMAVMNIVSIPMFIVHEAVVYRRKLHAASWLTYYGEGVPAPSVPLFAVYEGYVGRTIERFWGEVLEKQFTSAKARTSPLFRPLELHSSVAPKIVSQEVWGK